LRVSRNNPAVQECAGPRIRSGCVLPDDPVNDEECGRAARPATQKTYGHSARPAATRSRAEKAATAAAELAIESRVHLPLALPTPAIRTRLIVLPRAQR